MDHPEGSRPGDRGSSPEAVEAGGSQSTADRVFGFVGGGMVLAALVLLFTAFGGGDAAPAIDPSALQLVAPEASATVDGAIELVFRTQAKLEAQPGGWGADGLHVHAEINGTEIMPAANDIRTERDGTYHWVLAGAPKGEVSVRLRWSDLDHKPIEAGASEVVRIMVR